MALERTRIDCCKGHHSRYRPSQEQENTPMRKRTFEREFKLQVVRQLVTGEKRLSQLCREHGLCQTLVRRWREQYEHAGEDAWLGSEPASVVERDAETRIAALEAALGRAHLENDFLRHALATLRKGGSPPRSNGR
jgi:transposase-like protein